MWLLVAAKYTMTVGVIFLSIINEGKYFLLIEKNLYNFERCSRNDRERHASPYAKSRDTKKKGPIVEEAD